MRPRTKRPTDRYWSTGPGVGEIFMSMSSLCNLEKLATDQLYVHRHSSPDGLRSGRQKLEADVQTQRKVCKKVSKPAKNAPNTSVVKDSEKRKLPLKCVWFGFVLPGKKKKINHFSKVKRKEERKA